MGTRKVDGEIELVRGKSFNWDGGVQHTMLGDDEDGEKEDEENEAP